METGSVNIKELNCFHLRHLKEFDDYITLHNLSMLLTFIVTFYLMHCSYTREVVKRDSNGFFSSRPIQIATRKLKSKVGMAVQKVQTRVTGIIRYMLHSYCFSSNGIS